MSGCRESIAKLWAYFIISTLKLSKCNLDWPSLKLTFKSAVERFIVTRRDRKEHSCFKSGLYSVAIEAGFTSSSWWFAINIDSWVGNRSWRQSVCACTWYHRGSRRQHTTVTSIILLINEEPLFYLQHLPSRNCWFIPKEICTKRSGLKTQDEFLNIWQDNKNDDNWRFLSWPDKSTWCKENLISLFEWKILGLLGQG